jgi:hypothetical protein
MCEKENTFKRETNMRKGGCRSNKGKCCTLKSRQRTAMPRLSTALACVTAIGLHIARRDKQTLARVNGKLTAAKRREK